MGKILEVEKGEGGEVIIHLYPPLSTEAGEHFRVAGQEFLQAVRLLVEAKGKKKRGQGPTRVEVK